MPRLHAIERLSLVIVALTTLGALAAGRGSLAAGIGAGGLLGVANFYALRRLMGAIVRARPGAARGAASLLLVLKFGILAVILYLAMTHLPLDPMGVLAGFSIVVVAIFVEGFRVVLRGAAAESE